MNDDQTPASAWGATVPPAPPQPPWEPPQGQWGPPQPAWGQPGYPPAYSSPPRKSRKTAVIITASVIGGLLVLGILVAAAIAVFVSQLKPATNATKTYLTALEQGNYASAYSMLCPADQASVSESQFAAAKASLHPTSFRITKRFIQHSNAITTDGASSTNIAYIYYTVTESNGLSYNSFQTVIKLNGTWTVCHDA